MDPELRDYLGQMEERIKQLISDTATRTDERFDALQKHVDQQIGSLGAKVERLDGNVAAVMIQLSTYNKALSSHDDQFIAMGGTQAAMQKAFEALARQLREHRHDNGGTPKN